jgi:oligopeptide/dipeptide ABC transporter ATP-binding protein
MRVPLLELDNLVTLVGGGKRFLAPARPPIRAVDGVSLAINDGEIFGLVGESGCGKSTLAKTVLGLLRETSGSITLAGRKVSGVVPKTARILRRDIQYVHQDPGAALDPWWRVGHSIDEALRIVGVDDKTERDRRIDTMLAAVGLDASFRLRYPHELSGGQQRRVGLARILVLQPKLVILDEPTAGLDLSVQATVLRLMRDLRDQLGLTYIFISHDLSVVERMCHRVGIMYLGRIVEAADTPRVFARPAHPYTRALLAAAPRLETGRIDKVEVLEGDPPSASAIPSGCTFRNRCRYAIEACAASRPLLEPVGDGHIAACHRLHELAPGDEVSAQSA